MQHPKNRLELVDLGIMLQTCPEGPEALKSQNA